MSAPVLDVFTRHYLAAALFFSRDEDYGDDELHLAANYDINDCAPDFLLQAFLDCQKFQHEQEGSLRVAYEMYRERGFSYHPDAGSPEACAGHDFFLTRQGHGAGFWDRGFGPVGDALTGAAKAFPELHLFVLNGQVHAE